ncbi:flippase [Candidatus Parcubacteria bacterium]|nr:MAG: flippase [Candidatus Parcubacteria bacterium]
MNSMWRKVKSLLLTNRGIRQTVLKNTFWLFAGNVGSKLLRAALIIYAARILGTSEYGIFSYVVSLAGFFSLFSDIGLSPLLTRESVKNKERAREYIATTLFIKLGILIATVLFTVLVAPTFVTLPQARNLIPIAAILLAFDSIRAFGFAIVRAQNRMQIEATYIILTDIFITGISIPAISLVPASATLAMTYTIGSGIGSLLLFWKLRKYFKNIISSFNKRLIGYILGSAWPFAVIALLGAFMLNIDTIILGWFRSAHEIGLYGAAQRPVQLLYVFPSLFTASLFPIISKLVQAQATPKLKKVLETAITAMMGFAIPVAIGGILLGKQIIALLFGPAYLPATPTFQLLLVTILAVIPGGIVNNSIFAYNRQRVFIVSTIAGALTNVVLDLLLIPPYGIAGSAVATIISQFIVVSYNWMQLKRINPFHILPHIPKIVTASLAMALFTSALASLHIHILINIPISIAFYLGTLFLLKERLLLSEGKAVLALIFSKGQG